MNSLKRYDLVLAVYPSARGFAFTLFEGPLSAIDWGVRRARGQRKNELYLRIVDAMLARHRPDVVVLQDTSSKGTHRSRRVSSLNTAIGELAERHGIPVYAYSRAQVRLAFGHLLFTSKHAIAKEIAEHISVFERYLPPPRKPWMAEDGRMGLFDAAALALTFFKFVSEGQGKPPE